MGNELMRPADNALFELPQAFKNIDQIVGKGYLQSLTSYPIVPCGETAVNISETACFFPIRRIILDKREDILQKLASVYAGAGSVGANLAMIIRGYDFGETEIYLGVCCEDTRVNGAYPKAKVLFESFAGNFPGCRDEDTGILNCEDTRILLNKCYDLNYSATASVSCISSLRGEGSGKDAVFCQGIDKVIETMSGKDYTIVILARPLLSSEIEAVQRELEQIYTQLSVYSKIQMATNWSMAQSLSQSLTETLSESMSRSMSASLNVGKSKTSSRGKSVYEGQSAGINVGFDGLGGSIGSSSGSSENEGTSEAGSIGRAISDAISAVNGRSAGYTGSRSDTRSVGESVQLVIDNKTITETLVRIDEQLKRLRKGKGMGMFASAAYVLSPSLSQTRMAASSFKAIMSGDDTDLESASVNVWTGTAFKQILAYLKQFRHPQFWLDPAQIHLTQGQEIHTATATPAVLLTSPELAIFMGLPRNKVNGLPVRESVVFERNVVRMNQGSPKDELRLGRIYYLGHEEKNDVLLNLDSLTMHCFITGTTGSGKSNTVYGLLNNILAVRVNVHFMVIEPVKGDYKTVFGHRDDVNVYGTNGAVTELLRMNPFRFRSGVHVLEHIDYLISIFNVCWPMEAAMPSVLKQAVERAYECSGWDLRRSENTYSSELFPSFEDVLNAVNQIMDESDYSAENKGNYKGALCTRLQELTTGLNSMIFVCDDLTDEELFERNVIVDLSRLGSLETKALIMGFLVVRLKEYRQGTNQSVCAALQHIMVLEEAHNLLKKTSTEQSAGTANVVGRSVEMLSNSLAEMRSAGEGFIIVDQAPGLLDLSVIRNTNTKIILRLPESSDREISGQAISLNREQIDELARLPTGVAAVYQNDWIGAVLVKIPYEPVKESVYCMPAADDAQMLSARESLGAAVARQEADNWIKAYYPHNMAEFYRLPICGETKCALLSYVSKDEGKRRILPQIAYSCFNAREALEKICNAGSVDRIRRILTQALVPDVGCLEMKELDFLIYLLVGEACSRDDRFARAFDLYTDHMKKEQK